MSAEEAADPDITSESFSPHSEIGDRSDLGVLKMVGTVTVTYYPDIEILQSQLRKLPAESPKIIIDNSANPEVFQNLLIGVKNIRNVYAKASAENQGLPAGLNAGVAWLHDLFPDVSHVMLLDQDSEPEAGMLATLFSAHHQIEIQGLRPGIVGPRIIDIRTGHEHGFHCIDGWRWLRKFPPSGSSQAVICAGINCSGTLMRVALYRGLGGLDESFFMDQLDTDWSFRVSSAGYGLFGVPQARLMHRMGEETWRIWLFYWRLWPYRQPWRHYYVFRNAFYLMRRNYVPLVWKIWVIPKLLLTFMVHLIADSNRVDQMRQMIRGSWDGIESRATNE